MQVKQQQQPGLEGKAAIQIIYIYIFTVGRVGKDDKSQAPLSWGLNTHKLTLSLPPKCLQSNLSQVATSDCKSGVEMTRS